MKAAWPFQLAFVPTNSKPLVELKDHQGGDYLATITISGNVAVAEQLINERLNEQYHPRQVWVENERVWHGLAGLVVF